MADERPSPARLVSAPAAMTGIMLLVAAVGEWLLIPSPAVQRLDEGGVARASGLLGEVAWLPAASELWSSLTLPGVVHTVVAVVALVLLARRRVDRRALLVVPIGLLGWALEAWCKEIVDRPRPDAAVIGYSSWSYPSGHATNIALGAVLLIALLRAVRAARVRWATTALVLVVVALTLANRVVLAVHHPSDVLAGLVLGTAMGVVALSLLRAGTWPVVDTARR